MRVWLGLTTVQSARCIQGIVSLWNMNCVEASGGHLLNLIIEIVSCENISALFSNSFLHEGVGFDGGNIPGIVWNNHVFLFTRASL